MFMAMEEYIDVIYLALCNQILSYSAILEEEEVGEEELPLIEYIISRSEELRAKLEPILENNPKDENLDQEPYREG